jgi:hypothetical protein
VKDWNGSWEKAPKRLFMDKTISDKAVRLYLVLEHFAGNSGSCCPTQAQLSEIMSGASRVTLWNLSKELSNHGFIRIEKTGRKNIYNMLSGVNISEQANQAEPIENNTLNQLNVLPEIGKAGLTSDVKLGEPNNNIIDLSLKTSLLPPTPLISDTRTQEISKHLKASGMDPRAFLPIWDEWVTNKQGKKWKNITAEKKAVTHLLDICNKNLKQAQKIVDQSLANNWQGLFPLKLESTNSVVVAQQSDRDDDFPGYAI